MTEHPPDNQPRRSPLIRKISWTALAGLVVYVCTETLSGILHVSRADQLVLSVLTGGVALLVQYLAEFEQRLYTFENRQQRSLGNLDTTMQRGFAGVNEATELYEEIEKSALQQKALKQAIRRAGHFTEHTNPLALRLADSEVEQLATTLKALADGHEVFYEGEDREYLLGLTRLARTSIMATSRANANGLEGGFWLTDLASRYLDLQRVALRRGVNIKRVFLFESPDLMSTELVKRILTLQRKVGIDIKLLVVGPADGSIADFVLFDDQISHETTPVTRQDDGALTTRLVLNADAVQSRVIQFQHLWRLADRPTETTSELFDDRASVPPRTASG